MRASVQLALLVAACEFGEFAVADGVGPLRDFVTMDATGFITSSSSMIVLQANGTFRCQ
jgi:hypothetical protein